MKTTPEELTFLILLTWKTSLLGHRPLVSQRSFFWSMSAMLGLLTISTQHATIIKYMKDASRSSDADINNVMLSHLEAKAQPQHCKMHATGEFTRDSHIGLQPFSKFLGVPSQNRHHDVDYSASVCELKFNKRIVHFPHAMQQLYPCISHWYANEQKPSVLAWNKDVRDHLTSRFVTGVLQSLTASRSNNLTFLDTDVTPLPNSSMFVSTEPISGGYVVNSQNHLRKFRDDTVGLIHHRVTSCSSTLRIGILNRRKNRRLLNERAMIMDIKHSLPNSTIRVAEFENATFEDQVGFFSTVDVLVSPHGAQLTGLAFMPNCGQILELTPKGYHIPYYFGSLANASGLGYGYVYMSSGDPVNETKTMNATFALRKKMRSANFCPNTTSIVQGVLDLVQDWNYCCKQETSQNFLQGS